MSVIQKSIPVICILSFLLSFAFGQQQPFNNDWEFVKGTDSVFSEGMLVKNGSLKWEKITLPHTANIEPVQKKEQQWQGICFYRKFFSVPSSAGGKHIAVQFDAAMQEADVYVNGKHIFRHIGGYLPFYIDISNEVKTGSENNIVVRLDNRDNPLIPPGKALKVLDFNYYSGIYRNAWLIIKDKLHFSNAIAENKVAGGGIFVHCENISPQGATMIIKAAIRNDDTAGKTVQMRVTLIDKTGKTVAHSLTLEQTVSPAVSGEFTQTMQVTKPVLWSPENPYLYRLTIEALSNGKVVEKETIPTGIKKVRIERDAFYLNDKKVKIRGTNRHQEYPYIGNALSDNAQYRDAWKIKQAGFNFVRCCHYPQSPAFFDACDELGIMVMDPIPGWQFPGNDSFRVNSYQNIRDMIRRDRNHASIILWEASLNETGMKKDYMQKAHAIVHEELPFAGVYSAGWINDVYDVFLPARQHARAPDYWKKYDKAMPLLIAEYGDWEYYAQNAGFNQTAYKDIKPEERTSRQLRSAGQKGLQQQSLNYQEAHNDDLYGNAIGDVNWLMFDYNRGYAADIESSGIMDIMRLPKFSFYFFQSQMEPVGSNAFNKPMLFIASYWQHDTDTAVKIYSNCDEVELFLNGQPMGRHHPDADQYSTNLKHPPFTFHLPVYHPGILLAKGYIKNRMVAQQQQRTAEAPLAIRIRADDSGKNLKAGQNDIIFIYADIVDKYGTVVHDARNAVDFQVTGDATAIGQHPLPAEAGTAGILLRAGASPGKITISAKGENIKGATLILNSD